ncbi:DedA family protein [Curtobacterium sp. VKM Ac-2922]|uniref:DedA family protein n=1 Tax=Curtobacterium sp. VKM Ac-2922 TaxID=2929475 RepID=UPI001FB3B513|nr:DedA family protein [Curtobacterium sp. VKM Ac-2922]MCJ1714586.1 DedA family protein [Curtobacterium sp. VKM Ac-2922]
MDILSWLTNSADQIPEAVRWLVAAGFAALEVLGLGPFVPGEIAVLLLGATFDSIVGAIVLVVAVTIGASVGDHVLYFLGRRFGSGIRDRKFVQRLGVERWDAAIGVVERRGAMAIIATRLVPVIRTLTPLAAGTAKLPQARFTTASLIGSLTWALLWGGCGFLLQSSIAAAQAALGNVTWIVAGVIAAVVVLVVGFRAARKRGLLPEHLERRTVLSWSVVGVSVLLVVLGVVSQGGIDFAPWSIRVLGVVTAIAAAAVAVMSARSGRPVWNVLVPFVVVVGGLVGAAVHHGIPASFVVVVTVVLAVWALASRSTRTGTAALVLAGLGTGIDTWPWAWDGGWAVIGSLGSLCLLAALVIGTVAAVGTWRDVVLARYASATTAVDAGV